MQPLFSSVPFEELRQCFAQWMLDAEIECQTDRSIGARQMVVRNLFWWMERYQVAVLDSDSIRQFLAYLTTAHTLPEGRWGQASHPRLRVQATRPLAPSSVATYDKVLRTFCNWMAQRRLMDVSPMIGIKKPINRSDQIQPLESEQLVQLVRAARQSPYPARDRAVLLLLLDTAMRESELVNLNRGHIHLESHSIQVLGKGRKRRTLYMGVKARAALEAYLAERGEMEPDAPLFVAHANRYQGQRLTRSGLIQLVRSLGERAGLQGVRCSPHTLRHTSAVEFLRGGGNEFTLMMELGHTTLAMTRRYVAVSQADLREQHRKASPVDRLT